MAKTDANNSPSTQCSFFLITRWPCACHLLSPRMIAPWLLLPLLLPASVGYTAIPLKHLQSPQLMDFPPSPIKSCHNCHPMIPMGAQTVSRGLQRCLPMLIITTSLFHSATIAWTILWLMLLLILRIITRHHTQRLWSLSMLKPRHIRSDLSILPQF